MALFNREPGRCGVRFPESRWDNDPMKLAFILGELKNLGIDVCILTSKIGFIDFVGGSPANQFQRKDAVKVDCLISELLENLDRYMALEGKFSIIKKAMRGINEAELKAIADILLGADSLSIEEYNDLIK